MPQVPDAPPSQQLLPRNTPRYWRDRGQLPRAGGAVHRGDALRRPGAAPAESRPGEAKAARSLTVRPGLGRRSRDPRCVPLVSGMAPAARLPGDHRPGTVTSVCAEAARSL